MTGKLDKLGGTVKRLVSEFGKNATLIRPETVYDPNTGQTYTTDTEYSVIVTPPADYTLARIDGTLIEKGDTVVRMAANGLAVVPSKSDKVKMDGVIWSVFQAGHVYTGEKVGLYVLHLRK